MGPLLGEGRRVERFAKVIEERRAKGDGRLVRFGGRHFAVLDAVMGLDQGREWDLTVEAEFTFLQFGSVAFDAVGVEERAQGFRCSIDEGVKDCPEDEGQEDGPWMEHG